MTFRHRSNSPRRVIYAFGLGLALSVAGLAALAAGARDNLMPSNSGASSEAFFRAQGSQRESISFVRYDRYAVHQQDNRPHRHHHAGAASSFIRFAGMTQILPDSQTVCVRLCDGYFFPLPTAADDIVSQEQACNSLCPDAPTEVYYRNGENIEESVSASGKLYSALPASLRYRAASDGTCACHRNTIAYAPLKDVTLRHGDAIMTPAGFLVFRGVEGVAHGANDFAALDGAGLVSGARGTLRAMERASLTPAHPTLKDWLLSQNAGPGLGPQAATRTSTQVAMSGPAIPRAPSASGDGKIQLLTWRGSNP